MIVSSETIKIQNNTEENGELMVFDISGRLMNSYPFNSKTETSISNSFKPGVYCAKAVTANKKFVVNFIAGK